MDDYIYRFCSFLGAHFPVPFLYCVGRMAARLKYIFIRSVRTNVRTNVRIILEYRKNKRGIDYTEKELTYIVKQTYYNFSRYLTDFFTIPRWDIQTVRKKVKIENMELLDEGLAYGKGVVALTSHIGNWELAGIVSAILGYRVTAVAIPYRSSVITRIYKEKRNSKGVEVLLTGTNPKGPLKALRDNRILAMLGDKVFTEKGMEINFLGVDTVLPRGPATLAVQTGAFYTAGFFIMEKDRYRFFFKRINQPPASMEKESKISFLFTNGAKIIEEVILDYPSQWLNFSPIVVKNTARINGTERYVPT